MQRAKLNEIAQLTHAMSGAHNANLWTDTAVRNHPNWEKLRQLAQQALSLLKWEELLMQFDWSDA